MAQLDKTFPTNDCSMCIMAPKLVSAGRHPDIEILTNSEVLGMTGRRATSPSGVRKRPRYVNMEKCTGCGSVRPEVPLEGPERVRHGLSKRKAIYALFPQAVPLKYAIDTAIASISRPANAACARRTAPPARVDFEQKGEEAELHVGSSSSRRGIRRIRFPRETNTATACSRMSSPAWSSSASSAPAGLRRPRPAPLRRGGAQEDSLTSTSLICCTAVAC